MMTPTQQRAWALGKAGELLKTALNEAEKEGVPPTAILNALFQQTGHAAAYIAQHMKFMNEEHNGAVFLNIISEAATGAQKKIERIAKKNVEKAAKKADIVLQ